MLFGNPEGLKTWAEILEVAVSGMRPERRARLEAEAQDSGRSVQEVVEPCLSRQGDDMTDLVNLDWERQPYGKDPLLRKASDR
jgi:hypothetical protein